MKVSLALFFLCCAYGGSAQHFYLVIGTYTGTGSKGIYVYNFNAATGHAQWVSNTDSAINPSYVTFSHNRKYVYAVSETNGAHPGSVSSYSFNQQKGTLQWINTQLSGGDDPCYVAANASDQWLAVANYTGGNMALFPLTKNGAIGPLRQLMQDSGSSINTVRQDKAHVHESVFAPDHATLLAPDLGLDRVMIYRFNPLLKMPLQKAAPAYISTLPGSGPRHITFDPRGKFAYLIAELDGTVTAFRVHGAHFAIVQRIATHPTDFHGTIGSAEIQVSGDGRFLYASNRGDENTITIFSVDALTGKLHLIGYQPVMGKAPRNFILDPTGNYLLVANQDSDNIIIFKRDKATGLLQETKEPIHLPRPVCLQMVRMRD